MPWPIDSFANRLERIPKVDREQAIIREIVRVSAISGEPGVSNLVDSIAFKGKRWKKLIVKCLGMILATESMAESAPLAQRLLRKLLQIELVLRDKETGAQLNEICGLIARLEEFPRDLRPFLTVRFETPDAYVYGLCAIAAWASAHARDLTISSEYPRVEHFLQRAGVLEALNNPNADAVQFDSDTILGFTRIDAGASLQADRHVGRLRRLFEENVRELPAESAQALSICFSELTENAIKHGCLKSPAWLFANYHPQHRIMHVCVCDRGVGIRETFEQSHDARLRALADHSCQWLREATELFVTSKSEGHSGYGLYVARELCRRNGGLFAVVSGGAAFSLRPKHPDAAVSDVEELREVSPEWRGTLIAMQFRLDRTLDLGPVYDFPAPDDTESVDLFND